MAKFSKKPVVIEAWKAELEAPFPEGAQIRSWVSPSGSSPPTWEVYDFMHDTWVKFWMGWWIIKGVGGEFYPCDPVIFAATYEPVTEAPMPRNPIRPAGRTRRTRLSGSTDSASVVLAVLARRGWEHPDPATVQDSHRCRSSQPDRKRNTNMIPPNAFCLFLDGNQWCAVRPDFINLQESPAGFGSIPSEAMLALQDAIIAELTERTDALPSPPPEPAVREDKPAPPGEKFDAEKWAERTITWLANEGAAWIGSTTTDENWGHRMASPEGLAVCRNIMRDNYRAAYAAGLAARDGERVRPTWHTTGRYCCNCGKLLSQHINQRHCHPNKADVYESPSQPPAPEVRP